MGSGGAGDKHPRYGKDHLVSVAPAGSADDVEDIDKALRLGFNHPMGQFELADFNGLDVVYNNAAALAQVYGDRFRPPQLMRNLVESGYLGRKTGRGFYDYSKVGPERG